MTRKQVPPGTRNARTGEYIRRPVRVTSGKPPKKPPRRDTCVCVLVLSIAALADVAYRALHPYVSFRGWV